MTRAQLTSARVYDPVLRLLHWVNAVLISLLLASGLAAMFIDPGRVSAWLHDWHGVLGTALIATLAARLAWGLTGPRHARLADMWQPAAWRSMPGMKQAFSTPVRFGHHAVASLAYLVLYGVLAVLSLTGLILLATNQGMGPLESWLAWHASIKPLPDSTHTYAAWTVLAFVGVHLAALVLHPLLHRLPVAQAMITGVQYLPGKDQ